MLISIQTLSQIRLEALDGEIGKYEQFFFDDREWTARHLVIRPGNWFNRKKVLISPLAVDWEKSQSDLLSISLTRDQIENSPDIDANQPISRTLEKQVYDYYRWPYYWTGAGVWGSAAFPPILPPNQEKLAALKDNDIHLRSSKEFIGYGIQAIDRDFGQLDDLLVELPTWRIRYLVIDTVRFWPSKSVLIPPDWVDSISWRDKLFQVPLKEEIIRQAPDYDPLGLPDREFEKRLYRYYGKRGYWEEKRLVG